MPTVLVVDDSAVDRRLVGGILSKSAGIDVEFAVDGKEALRKVQTKPPALVITDLVMPEMNGLELVSAIRDQYPQVPVILMTGKGSEDIAVKALQLGAASYVPKTALHSLLLETVKDVLDIVKDILRKQRLIEFLRTGRFVFVITNDADMIPTLISYVQNIVISIGLCDEADVIRVCIALEEALRNAMFHGNLEISSEQREGDATAYAALLAERTSQDPWQGRCLHVEVAVSKERGTFTVRDQGPGFDPQKLPDPTDPANLEKVSGRGLLLMRTFMDEVHFNATGNEVTMVKTKPSSVEGIDV